MEREEVMGHWRSMHDFLSFRSLEQEKIQTIFRILLEAARRSSDKEK